MDKSRSERNLLFSEPMLDLVLAKEKLGAGAIALDVRTPQEVAEGTYPNAICIPHTEINSRIAELENFKEKEILIFCKVGGRADFALQVLKAKGFGRVYNVGGYSEII